MRGLAVVAMRRVVVGALSEFPEGAGVLVRIGGLRLALFRRGADVFAIEDRCPHRGFPLYDGTVDGISVRCRTHGSCFNLMTGELERGPARRGVGVYRTVVVGDTVEVEVAGE